MQLSKMLMLLCKKRSWSLARLAKETGIAPATLHGWKTGRSTANMDDLRKVAIALEVSLHELLFGEPDPFHQAGTEVLKELFSGDVRVTLHRIERRK
ncbi:MAG: helix-turn-helix domain-containing protein [Bacteriovoracia bacterium]